METYDLIIRGGTVVDGTGAAARVADIAVRNGVIVAVGQADGTAESEIDATGLTVTPGFIDLHTHYDGQAIWSSRLNPSSSHGVTTVVMGNCGVGFAPCRPEDRPLLCITMEGVEDIPGVVMKEGLTWEWETFPEFLNAVEARARDIDVGVLVPHSAVRVYTMGKRGADRVPADADDLKAMHDVISEGVRAGALGFGSTRTAFDRRADGEHVPSFDVDAEELANAARAVRDAGGGVMQILPDLGTFGSSAESCFSLMKIMSEASGLPVTYTMSQVKEHPDHWRELLRLTQEHNKAGGGLVHPQFFPRPVGMLAGLELTSNPFVYCPSYQAIAHLPLAERVAEMRRPEVRARIVNEEPGDTLLPMTAMTRQWQNMYRLGDPPCYEPDPETSVAAMSRREGRPPEEIAYDLLLENDGHALLLVAIANYAYGSLDYLMEMMRDPNCVIGLGDGGAHYGLICDSSYPTFVLTHWVRDRQGERLTLEEAVKALTSAPANVMGLGDRGILAPGYKADINILDHAAMTLHAPRIVDDLPGGGRRLDQSAVGYRWTIVSGEVIVQDDQPTGAYPGRLIRGRQTAAAVPAMA
ncbi:MULTISPECIES: amidohydrolase family protein [unclassified Sphingobium]|uniref:N-acyl-D-amino-acid deacylase family protein n=1 Tax=unclassified Sphingobium TaxID=2611147 RepID=UPI0035A673A1